MEDLTQAYSHVVSNTVYEQTAQKLDDVYNKLTEEERIFIRGTGGS